jgi:hypothetical protein
MSQLLISHSPDLKRLRDEGYEVEVREGYLLIHNVPYVNSSREIVRGTLVSELTLRNSTTTARPTTHVIYFSGEFPCNKDGSEITAIQHASQNQVLGSGININHSFSNKPQTGYPDYYSKVTRYADIISAPAKALDPLVSEKTFKVIPDTENAGVFQYLDTNSSRANVNRINQKLSTQRVAIVGLGGTGAYILDLIAKTPIQEIHLFDGDDFLQHNAFRSPGAASLELLNQKLKKVNYYLKMYSQMHKGIQAHDFFINHDNITALAGVSFVFICVDKNSARKTLVTYLIEKGIPFIDVGLGVLPVDDCLVGTVRCTAVTNIKNDHLFKRVSSSDSDIDDAYSTNIQIADLNALNAALAVIKWKKFCGFYQDLENEHHSTYSINVAQLINEDLAT